MRLWTLLLLPLPLLAEESRIRDIVDNAYLEFLAGRLTASIGRPGYPVRTRLVDAPESNAYARESVIVVTRELIVRLQRIREKEDALAAILAHEIGHVLLGHEHAPAQGTEQPDGQSSVSQAREFEADAFALFALKKAGYSADSLKQALVAIGEKEQGNPYLNTHPTLHARMARLQSRDAGDHQRLADLEHAFGSIEVGGVERLRAAVFVLDRELLTGRNPFLEQALALARHRLWEATASVDELMFKTAIASRYFDDAMLQKKEAVRGPSRKIPGNLAYYRAAVSAYERLENPDSITCSAKLALLSYDPARRHKDDCPDPSSSPLSRALTLNNYGIVYFQRGEARKSLASFQEAALLIDRYHETSMRNDPYRTARDLARSRALPRLDPLSPSIRFAALFNLGKWYCLNGQPEKARTTWQSYLKNHDPTSAWAQHARLSMR
ncbi:MAG: M48 family metalloprotease [Spirochaetales bacterium]|nr:M48 family metalloprotease [Spirochaetales bacterium]